MTQVPQRYRQRKFSKFPQEYFDLFESSVSNRDQKNTFYCSYFILRQIVKASNPPQDVASYTLKENDLRIVRSKYSTNTGEFLDNYETIGFMAVRGSPEEVFFNYWFDQEKSKVLYSFYKRRIPNFLPSVEKCLIDISCQSNLEKLNLISMVFISSFCP